MIFLCVAELRTVQNIHWKLCATKGPDPNRKENFFFFFPLAVIIEIVLGNSQYKIQQPPLPQAMNGGVSTSSV